MTLSRKYVEIPELRVKRGNNMKICPTGIEGLDQILGGGIPCGSTVLVEGPPGAGKTSFAAKFVYEACRKGEKSIYLSFVEGRESFYAFMRRLGLDFVSLEEKGLFEFIEALPIHNEEAIRLILERLLMDVVEKEVSRVAIDSITVLIHAFGPEKAREIITSIMLREFKKMGVTTLLIAEKPRSYTEAEVSIEEYIADTVIELNYRIEYGKIVRYMRILKARGTSIPLSEIPFTLITGDVIHVQTPIILHEIPAIDAQTKYITGVEFIDKLLEGIPKGSQVLIIVEPGLDPIIPLLLGIIPLVAKYGGPAIIRSYTKSPNEIKRFIEQLAHSLKIPNINKVLAEIEITATNPITMSLQEIASTNARLDALIKPKFVGILGLNVLLELYPSTNMYLAYHLNNVFLRRKLGITGFYTISGDPKRGIPGIDIYDIIVHVERIEEEGEELYKIAMLRHPTIHKFKTLKLRPYEIPTPMVIS